MTVAPSTEYRLSFPNAVHHEAEISVTFRGISKPLLEVVMSRSSPGRYALHEFAKNVYHFSATDPAGTPLNIVRPNPDGWTISGHHDSVVVHYTLFGDHADGTYVGIDETHAHLNLPLR
jgi:predicted metalloprotease with PDZ domain